MTSSVDVVVPTYGNWAITARCLDHLAAQTIPHRVIVVDDAGPDDTVDRIRSGYPNVHLIALERNSGFAAACNHGIRAGTADIVVLINNDVEAGERMLELLVSALDDDPTVASAAPLLFRPDGSIDALGLCADPTMAGFVRLGGAPAGATTSSTLLGPYGAVAAYRRSALDEVGLLDEGTFMYGEELDLALRLSAAGWGAVAVPESTGVHLGGATSVGARRPNAAERDSVVATSCARGGSYAAAMPFVPSSPRHSSASAMPALPRPCIDDRTVRRLARGGRRCAASAPRAGSGHIDRVHPLDEAATRLVPGPVAVAISKERSGQFKRASTSLVSLVGGISLAVIPAAVLAIAARLFTFPEQGRIAVAIMVATFVGQVVFAVVVESRLSSHLTDRRVTFPRWLAALGVLAAIAVAAFPTDAVILCLALPVLVAALEVGRGVSVAERLDTRETAAAVLVGVGALSGVLSALVRAEWALVPLVAGIATATVVRALPVPHRASTPHLGTMGWVVTDVSITGIVNPLINATILALLGPVQSVLFTAVSTVSGLLAIPLNFMRLRLLKDHSPLDIVVSGFALVVATIAIGVAEFTGVLGFLFGEAWTIVSTAGLLGIACLWRAASLATTLPFAALRRSGAVRIVTVLRASAAVFTFAIALAALATGELVWVFAALLVGELVQALLYEAARRRLVRGSAA